MRYRMLRFPEGKSKAVTFSYDDGCRADKRLAQTVTDYGIKCTFNINSAYLGKSEDDWHLTKDEIEKYILANGHEIAVHGAQHKANGILRTAEGIQDVINCRLALEKDFKRIVRGMAYPDTGISRFHNGTAYGDIKNYLTELDIAYARALGEKNDSFELPSDWHRWMPNAHHNDGDVLEKIESFLSMELKNIYYPHRTPKLFYLWGHAYEFDDKNNWNRLEEICQKLGDREDIWYATNIEIYEYVTAYLSLVFSADCSVIHNPTAMTLWFEADGTLYTVKPDETLYL